MSEELIKLLENPFIWSFAHGLFLHHKDEFDNLSDKCDTTTFKINNIVIKVILIELHHLQNKHLIVNFLPISIVFQRWLFYCVLLYC